MSQNSKNSKRVMRKTKMNVLVKYSNSQPLDNNNVKKCLVMWVII